MRVQIKKFIAVLVSVLVSCGSSIALTHKVQTNETFYAISLKYEISAERLMAYNGFTDPGKLQVGQTLKIPTKEVKVAARVSAAKPAPKSKSLRVVLDPGHGGKDRGAVWAGVRESHLNLNVARIAEADLKAQGYAVSMTRRSDLFVSLDRRAQIANQYSNAIFVSIHFNATPHTEVRGAETFYVGSKGRYLAQAIQKALVANLKVRDRGCHFGKYSVLHKTACPAVLVECGFISNSYERSRCKTHGYQSSAAKAIVSGIARYDQAY